MVIITAEPKDVHALAVAKRLYDFGEDCCILSPADIPTRCRFAIEYGDGTFEYTINYCGQSIRSDTVTGLWLRRFRPYEIDQEITNEEVRQFAYDECRELFQGWAATVPNVINSNVREFTALRKVHQLHVAQSVGLRIPRTMVGNTPEAIATFCRSQKSEVVYKVLSNTKFGFYGTQTVTPNKLDQVEACKYAPTIFQERITVVRNLRVTIVDDKIFAATIETRADTAALDWRLDMNPVILPTELPSGVCDKLLALQRHLGLRYGAIDLIHNEHDEYVFLEVNPGGQFLFIEIATGQAISTALAQALISRAQPRPHL